MALDEDLKKKIADRLSSRTPEQKQVSQQSVQESAIRERVRSIAPKDVIPTIKQFLKDYLENGGPVINEDEIVITKFLIQFKDRFF